MFKFCKQYGVVVGVDGLFELDVVVCWGVIDVVMRNILLIVVYVVNVDVVMWLLMLYLEIWGVWQEDEGCQIVVNVVKFVKEVVGVD